MPARHTRHRRAIDAGDERPRCSADPDRAPAARGLSFGAWRRSARLARVRPGPRRALVPRCPSVPPQDRGTPRLRPVRRGRRAKGLGRVSLAERCPRRRGHVVRGVLFVAGSHAHVRGAARRLRGARGGGRFGHGDRDRSLAARPSACTRATHGRAGRARAISCACTRAAACFPTSTPSRAPTGREPRASRAACRARPRAVVRRRARGRLRGHARGGPRWVGREPACGGRWRRGDRRRGHACRGVSRAPRGPLLRAVPARGRFARVRGARDRRGVRGAALGVAQRARAPRARACRGRRRSTGQLALLPLRRGRSRSRAFPCARRASSVWNESVVSATFGLGVAFAGGS